MRGKIALQIVLFALSVSDPTTVFSQKRAATTPKPAVASGRSIVVATEPKAAVWIGEIRRGTTDEKGQLKIDRVPAGTHKIRVRAVGFVEKTQTLLPTQKGEIKIPLVKTTDEAEIAFQQAEALRESGTAEGREKAIELYKKALQLRPKFAEARVGWARIIEKSDPDAALEQIAEARKARPVYAEASTVEGRIYREGLDLDNAVKSFKRAIREANNFQPEAHTGLALAYKDQGNNTAAIAEFKIAIAQLGDSEPVVYQLLGEAYEQAGRKKEAIAAYEKFLQLAPTSNLATAVRSIIEQLKNQQNQGDTLELMPQ
ncbi:MAG: tetratricopeptide repeat protein [Acidobacteriota bacterium]|nr:tetratricopeptide repeat protein [Acidobacteriota bacterium]